MRPGIIGISVKIIPPDAVFPDQVEIRPPVPQTTLTENEAPSQEIVDE